MKPLSVLITAASRRVPLLRAFQNALCALGVPGRVRVADVNPLSPAVHLTDRWHTVPLSTDPGYIDAILDICRADNIQLVVPTIDDELVQFGQARARFKACGVQVVVSPPRTSAMCNDKYWTSVVLRDAGIAAAETFLPEQLTRTATLPLFVKPRFGRGGVGAFPVTSERELDFFLDYVEDPVVQEYLDGPEYTIDMLCGFDGRPLSIVPRERVLIRAGVSDRGRTVRDPRLIDLAQTVADALTFYGPVNIQCRVVCGRPVVFEINPRFSGGIPLTIAAGADFPRLLVQLALGHAVAPAIGAFRDGLWMTNYEEAVFLERNSATGDLALANPSKAFPVGDVA